jgi:hypothetical protein
MSFEAASLINNMIKVKSNERISLHKAINHAWTKNIPLEDKEEIRNMTERIRKSSRHTSVKMVKSILTLSQELPNKNQVDAEIDLGNQQNKRKSKRSKTLKKELSELPTLITKVPNDFKETSMYEFNFSMMRRFGGKIPNFLQPIGHNKSQKHKIAKIKDFMKQYFEILNPPGEANNNVNLQSLQPQVTSSIYNYQHSKSTINFNKKPTQIQIKNFSQLPRKQSQEVGVGKGVVNTFNMNMNLINIDQAQNIGSPKRNKSKSINSKIAINSFRSGNSEIQKPKPESHPQNMIKHTTAFKKPRILMQNNLEIEPSTITPRSTKNQTSLVGINFGNMIMHHNKSEKQYKILTPRNNPINSFEPVKEGDESII